MIGLAEILINLGANSPTLIFWIAVIVFAAVWLRRGGGRAERFIIAGASIKLIGNLLTIPLVFIVPWLIGGGYDREVATSIGSASGIFLKVVSMTGIICLLYGFWVKFREKNIEAAPEAIV